MLVGGSPSSGQVSLVHLVPPCVSASMDAFLCLEISPGMEEDFEICSVTLIMFRTGHDLLLGCVDETWRWPPLAADTTQGRFIRPGTCAGAAVL